MELTGDKLKRAEVTRTSVAFFHVSAILGGAERSFLDLLGMPVAPTSVNLPEEGALGALLKKSSWASKVHIQRFPSRLRQLSRKKGILNFYYLPLATLSIFSYSRAVLRSLRLERPQVIYSHGIKNHFLLSILGKMVGIPVVWHLQDFWPHNFFSRLFFRLAIHANVFIICNSQAVCADLDPEQKYCNKIRVIPNAINPEEYPFSGEVERRGQNLVIGFVGMLVPWKGPHILIEAAKILRKNEDFRKRGVFWIVGGVPYRTKAAVSAYAENLKVIAGEGVKFCGLQENLSEIYSKINIICHTSILPEPFGRVILEAMASGCIVIAADAGGPREIILPAQDGFLCKSGDPMALAKKIEEIIALTPEERSEIRIRARKKIEVIYSSTIYREKIAEFLREITMNETSL